MIHAVEPNSVAVIGAGIIGLSIAVQLQREGYAVTVVDRDEPMKACSAGNAGYLSEGNIFPPAAPDMLLQIPKLLMSRDGPLVVRPAYLPAMASWAKHAVAAARHDARHRVMNTLGQMTVSAYAANTDLAKHAGADSLLSREGGLVAYKTELALQKKSALLREWHARGIVVHRLTAEAVRDLEPALANDIVGGLYFENSGRCSNPRRLGLLYAEHLVRNGAQFVRAQVTSVVPSGGGGVTIHRAEAPMHFARAVVCSGYWSRNLLAPYFRSIPLVSERGYHLMLPETGLELRRPVVFGEPHFAATPMEEGLRLAGTAEFAPADARPDMSRATMLLALAQKYLRPINGTNARPWMGVRPSLPDGLPAIGEVPSAPPIFYAFGHAHSGLTLSGVTAQCVSALISGRRAPVDLALLDAARFSRSQRPSKAPRSSYAQ
ncbi:NAD(P)/FAD-dependent oxidoreductase [Cupriavidus taiwanensis]|uniref:D-amino acid dehydrogenase small subunit n=1 Tax=Cupriavidus taiwanensis TaxID=164546 RepID=A0A7Z7JIZ9_9BURK|nr:FAD-dependent oxidoreductase [Cupriavidus taiwanensis]SOZ19509.1 D-amino acid dehydrogenase small subunit [Cupriavidus taiwanensis]SOZ97304.1 D-amino acid dehydrogenase small subunit [Cupriavidus taiwanensis]SPC26192.1 D-amino acid dehydrogenase small subunit [Cupriavidus taiwanensis]SPD37673.1 D-amino acid dehydrogenase small subunit [Cupriavidus taiwanensis]